MKKNHGSTTKSVAELATPNGAPAQKGSDLILLIKVVLIAAACIGAIWAMDRFVSN